MSNLGPLTPRSLSSVPLSKAGQGKAGGLAVCLSVCRFLFTLFSLLRVEEEEEEDLIRS